MILSIKNNSLSMAVLLMPPMTILVSVLIGYFYFKEQLFLIQNIGAILIFSGILFIMIGPN
ncbi:MAG TPA: hypothetical protein EYG89_01830 [Bacteroidia bacterium]|nr:hypothetical protein [Bacteroidia bacterium]